MCSKANRCIAGLATVLALMLVARPRLAAQDLIGYVEHTIDLPAFADGVTVGDWDHDRVLEVLVTLRPHEGYPLGAVACYGLHLDPLRWVLEHTISSPRGAPTNVAVGDVTGDGNEDVVFATDDGAGWGQVFVWSAGGLVWQSSPIQGIRGSGQLSLGDVDRDGRSEILLAVSWPGRYGVIYDDALGGYEASVPCSGTDAVSAAVGDVDGDGDLDAFLAVVKLGATGPNQVWFNNGAGTFTDSGQRMGENSTNQIILGDLNGDGDLDAVAVNMNMPNEVWHNTGNGNYIRGSQIFVYVNTPHTALGDLNGDGSLDLFMVRFDEPDQVMLNQGEQHLLYLPWLCKR